MTWQGAPQSECPKPEALPFNKSSSVPNSDVMHTCATTPSAQDSATRIIGMSTSASSPHLVGEGAKWLDRISGFDSVLAVIIHEAAHVTIAWTQGVKIKRVGISWRGPFIVREQREATADAKIAIAGPLANLLLALACWHPSLRR
jgi:hypothetical protein